MPDYRTHKRIERPLLVQTKRDSDVMKGVVRNLEEALEKAKAEQTRLAEEQTVVVENKNLFGEKYVNTVAQAIYRLAVDQFESNFTHVAQHSRWSGVPVGTLVKTYSHKPNETYVDFDFTRYLLDGVLSAVWNEAIELAAQVTGGAAGTLIRDLKEDKPSSEEANQIVKSNQEKKND